jgi:hypothetical protein
MKAIITGTFVTLFTTVSFAKCTEEAAAKLPFVNVQTNSSAPVPVRTNRNETD